MRGVTKRFPPLFQNYKMPLNKNVRCTRKCVLRLRKRGQIMEYNTERRKCYCLVLHVMSLSVATLCSFCLCGQINFAWVKWEDFLENLHLAYLAKKLYLRVNISRLLSLTWNVFSTKQKFRIPLGFHWEFICFVWPTVLTVNSKMSR